MTKRAQVVIGANYGDEGKGLMVDFYAAPAGKEAIVVRFNGGAQAGHTVQTPSGQRHVFSHFGAGTLAGAATFLSRHFVCSPALFAKEALALHRAGIAAPTVLADDRAPVTTPYDILLNQIVERFRSGARHGSCGMGFGETIERNLRPEYALTAGDLRKGDGFLLHRLDRIRREYMLPRLHALGVTALDDTYRALIASDAVMEDYVVACASFLSGIHLSRPEILGHYTRVVMEGAQGLLLDQTRGAFPYVTRSNTGVRNALDVAREAQLVALDITYATRAYLTRHGAGPLPHELPHQPYAGIVDRTNVPNEFQGALRFAHLDLDLLRTTVLTDYRDALRADGIRTTLGVAVSCLDQVDERLSYYANGALRQTSRQGFLAELRARLMPDALLASYGPTRNDVAAVPPIGLAA